MLIYMIWFYMNLSAEEFLIVGVSSLAYYTVPSSVFQIPKQEIKKLADECLPRGPLSQLCALKSRSTASKTPTPGMPAHGSCARVGSAFDFRRHALCILVVTCLVVPGICLLGFFVSASR